MSVKPFAAGNTLESLRDSDFDSCSAYGEVIDNSIQANSVSIKILFDPKGTDGINRVIFSDDGDGMGKDILQNCLRLGWSSRYNDRTGIGRFGVGMTLGAIHECRRVEVYSKTKSSEWQYTYLDLDEIEASDSAGSDWEIPSPIKKSPNIDIHSNYVPIEQGTIVVWSKYDRAQEKFKKVVADFRVWVGRTFRYYIWNENVNREKPITIELNGHPVFAIDPLYVRTNKTEFPDDLIAKEYDPIEWDWPINDPKIVQQIGKDKAKIHVRLSILPPEWRERVGAGQSEFSKKRHIPDNEGFSFLRKGREVGYDWIPHFQFACEEKDRFWGCEIHFGPELDRAFTVKNIKRGAVPSSELKKAINDKIGAWIKSQRSQITDHWAKQNKIGDIDSGKQELDGADAHIQSEKIAKVAAVPKGKLGSDKDVNEEVAKVAEIASEGNSEDAARWATRFQSQPFTIAEKGWQGPTFIDIHNMGGTDALFYNNRHKFFEVLNLIQREIKDGINVEFNAERLATLIDLLMIAYAKSESMLNVDEQMLAIDFLDHLKNNWGQFLKTYISTWQTQYDNSIAS